MLRRLGAIAVGGGSEAGAFAAARRLVANGATALVSAGLAGGLEPALSPGQRAIPAEILYDGTTYKVDPTLLRRFGGATVVRLAAVATPVARAADKARLFAATGAAVVDMESGAVAVVATAAGLPFAVLRVVCDPAGRDLPAAALAALDGNGTIAVLRVLASVLRHPGQIPALLRLARDAATARAGLRAMAGEIADSPAV